MTRPDADPTHVVEPLKEAAERRSLRAWLNAVDLAVYRSFRTLAIHHPEHVPLVRRYSTLGEFSALWLAMGGAGWLVDRRRRDRWRRAVLSVAAAHAASTTIKNVVGRKRPAVEDLPHLMATPTGLSFPSTHSAASFAAARAYGRLLPEGPLYFAATVMALSRLFLGVHYPSDVAAGAAVGAAVGSLGR